MVLPKRTKTAALFLAAYYLSSCAADPASLNSGIILESLLIDSDLAFRIDVETAPESRFDQFIQRFDRNSDQELTPGEFVGRDFVRFDTNGDGRVTIADFPGESGDLEPRVVLALDLVLARKVVRTAFGGNWQAVFRGLDADSNARLSRAEFSVRGAPVAPGRRDPFAALLASVGSWSDDELDWFELDAFVK